MVAVELLTPTQRLVIEGIFWERVSQAELARREHVSQQAIAHRKRRAIQSLRRTLNGGHP